MVEAVDQLLATAPVLVEMVVETVLLVMVLNPLLQILVVEAVVAQASPVLGVVEVVHLVL